MLYLFRALHCNLKHFVVQCQCCNSKTICIRTTKTIVSRTSPPVFVIVILFYFVSIAMQVHLRIVFHQDLCTVFVTTTLFEPNVQISDNSCKTYLPTLTKYSINSVKFSLGFSKTSRLLSPVPSLPSIPTFIICFAITPSYQSLCSHHNHNYFLCLGF